MIAALLAAAKAALPWLAKNVLPSVLASASGMQGQGQGQTMNTIGGQMPQQQQPMNQFMPTSLMQSRQMPSYGNIIQQMLAKYRG